MLSIIPDNLAKPRRSLVSSIWASPTNRIVSLTSVRFFAALAVLYCSITKPSPLSVFGATGRTRRAGRQFLFHPERFYSALQLRGSILRRRRSWWSLCCGKRRVYSSFLRPGGWPRPGWRNCSPCRFTCPIHTFCTSGIIPVGASLVNSHFMRRSFFYRFCVAVAGRVFETAMGTPEAGFGRQYSLLI